MLQFCTSSGYGASRFSGLVLDHVPGHQGRLRQSEEEGERQEAEHLEIHPHIGRLGPPDDLVEDGKKEKEQSPAERELAPAIIVHPDRFAHHEFEEQLAEREAAKKDGAKQGIDQRYLHFDEGIIVKPKRKATENSYKSGS